MSIQTLVTRGFGNGTFDSESIAIRGYTSGTLTANKAILQFIGRDVTIRELEPAIFLNFDYHPLTERRIIISSPQNFINVQLSAGKIHTYILQMFNNPTDKFRITLGLDFEGQDNAVTTWFSSVPSGDFIDHTIPLSRRAPKTIQLTQSPTNIFLPCDQFGSLINLPAGQIFFNIRNRENRDTIYTMILIVSPCVSS